MSDDPSDAQHHAPGAMRRERDSMGEVAVPASALYGAQTQRALDNFRFEGEPMPQRLIHALLLLKACAARANAQVAGLAPERAQAIEQACDALLEQAPSARMAHFPIDVFQTGSGTSTNMNANEVIATLAARRLGLAVSPNDDVNRAQSSNDVIPSALHVAARLALAHELLPALQHLAATLRAKGAALAGVIKTGRTHLMDAMPVRLDQVFGGWAAQIEADIERLHAQGPALQQLALGGTAVGTGVNAPAGFATRACAALEQRTGIAFAPTPDHFAAQGAQDAAASLSGQLKTTAVSLTKIANDLRWMNAGPLAGLAEIELPALQPGSSIMPGKVNPVIPEAVAMACVQVMGNDVAIGIAAASGNFELNTMLPVIARNLLQSLALLAHAARALADQAIAGLRVNEARLSESLARNPVLVTALNPIIGYLKAAEIAKRALAEQRPILDVADEMTDLGRERLAALLDPRRLTRGG